MKLTQYVMSILEGGAVSLQVPVTSTQIEIQHLSPSET